ncbi:M48 family metallopeptidase [Azovibrio restrictus]|uniref:M48 family metallopeptidase n=1 Tax=Azovibrio restrictus TaxID=146938 RepID=UPI0026EE1522|nr:SprT family zinc-dependent metalloprotease [Azovibrio restrictus]MDD3483112.1 SprT family zinc-dependent metalloprotease [Azovibrio restrictus]
MKATLDLGDFSAEVVRKAIKHVHLSVYPPDGRVRIAAPAGMELETIRLFAIAKLAWIKRQQRKILAQERETPREFLDRESHYVWGKRYLLKVVEKEAAPAVELGHNSLLLQVRPGCDAARRQEILDAWYREQIRQAVPALLEKWQPLIGVRAGKVFVQRMRTRWGSCNPAAGHIRLNTDLAKKPPECLEYIVVHELTHLLEPTHNARFASLMEGFLPHWRLVRDALNRLPVRHEDWTY